MNKETQTQETEAETTTEQSLNPPSEQATTEEATVVETEDGFENPDFSELTAFIEGEAEGEAPVAAKKEEEAASVADPTAPTEDAESTEAAEASTSEESTEEGKETKAEETQETEDKTETKVESTESETPAEAQPEPVKIPTREELQGLYDEHRKQALPQLEQMYQLSEEDAEALNEAPAKVLPKLAARLQYDAMLSSYNAVMAAIPSVVNRLIDAQRTTAEAEESFFSEWPELKDSKHQNVVVTAIKAFRSANPQATIEQTIKQAGVMAMIQAGLDPTNRNKTTPTTQPKPTAAANPKPAKPAGAGGSTQVAPPVNKQEETNEFTDLANLFAADR